MNVLSLVLAPAEAAAWLPQPNDVRRGPVLLRPEWVEICGPGPVRMGRRDEPVTEGQRP